MLSVRRPAVVDIDPDSEGADQPEEAHDHNHGDERADRFN